MAGGKNNTQRIENLESHAATLSARLDVFDKMIDGIDKLLEKCSKTTEGHDEQITVIHQQLLFVDLKQTLATLSSLKEDMVAVRKDIESLNAWRDERKREKDEASRRRWAFGPNIVAALISGAISILGVGLGVGLTYYLNRKQ